MAKINFIKRLLKPSVGKNMEECETSKIPLESVSYPFWKNFAIAITAEHMYTVILQFYS